MHRVTSQEKSENPRNQLGLGAYIIIFTKGDAVVEEITKQRKRDLGF